MDSRNKLLHFFSTPGVASLIWMPKLLDVFFFKTTIFIGYSSQIYISSQCSWPPFVGIPPVHATAMFDDDGDNEIVMMINLFVSMMIVSTLMIMTVVVMILIMKMKEIITLILCLAK